MCFYTDCISIEWRTDGGGLFNLSRLNLANCAKLGWEHRHCGLILIQAPRPSQLLPLHLQFIIHGIEKLGNF